jgi:DNA-binding CsgD family transcriptional regulator
MQEKMKTLTPKELEVIGELVQGKSAKQVGKALSISGHTVNSHKQKIYEKLGVDNISQLSAMYHRDEELKGNVKDASPHAKPIAARIIFKREDLVDILDKSQDEFIQFDISIKIPKKPQ